VLITDKEFEPCKFAVKRVTKIYDLADNAPLNSNSNHLLDKA
jgi:hypothetical protein